MWLILFVAIMSLRHYWVCLSEEMKKREGLRNCLKQSQLDGCCILLPVKHSVYLSRGQRRQPKSTAGNHCWITGSLRKRQAIAMPPPLLFSLVCQPTNCSLKRRALAGDEVEQLISRLSSLPQKHVGLSPVSGGTETLARDCKTHTHTYTDNVSKL